MSAIPELDLARLLNRRLSAGCARLARTGSAWRRWDAGTTVTIIERRAPLVAPGRLRSGLCSRFGAPARFQRQSRRLDAVLVRRQPGVPPLPGYAADADPR